MTYQGGVFNDSLGHVLISSETILQITSVDSSSALVVSGMASLTVQFGSATYTGISQVILPAPGLPEGFRPLTYEGQDNAGNVEAVHAPNLFVDATPPVAAYAAAPQLFFDGNRLFASTGTVFALSAADPLSAGLLASGVSQILLSIDGAPLATYESSWTFATQGDHTFAFQAVDNVGNLSPLQTVLVSVNRQTPTALLVVSTPSYTTGTTHYASSATRFSLTVASGSTPADAFQVNIDSGGNQVVPTTATFAFSAEGPHSIQFAAVRGGVADTPDTYSVIIDTTPPVSSLTVDSVTYAGGDTIRWLSTSTVSLASADALSGVAGSSYQVDGGTATLFAGNPLPLNFASGVHSLGIWSIDQVGNTEIARNYVILAGTATVTPLPSSATLTVTGLLVEIGTTTFAPATNGYFLSAFPSGTTIEINLDGAGYQTYNGSTLTLTTAGLHELDYFPLGGSTQTFRVTVDTAPPVTSVVSGTTTYAAGGVINISSFTPVSVTARDDLSGVATSYFAVDGGSVQVVSNPLPFFATGTRHLSVWSVDRVDNQESPENFTIVVQVDTTPPVTQITFSTAPYVNGSGAVYIASSTAISFVALDTGPINSGVAFTQYAVDGSSFTRYLLPFRITEGVHQILFQSQDQAGNIEPVKVSTVAVDATPPVTTLSVGSGPFISTATLFTLQAQDPVSQGAASGVKQIFVAIDSGTSQNYSSSFVLPSTGTHQLSWYSQDQVGNTEILKSSAVVVQGIAVDTSAPVALLISPSVGASGMDQIFGNGTVPVLGTAGGSGFVSYTLEFSVGAGGVGPYQSIRTSAIPVTAGTLGSWNTQSLSGFETLRLRTTTASGKLAISTATVFIGDPSLDLVLQNATKSKAGKKIVLNQPEGIAVDADGNLYVANSGGGNVLKFNAQGDLLASWNGLSGASSLALLDPTGVAVSPLGDVYVCDRATHRVLILGANGQVTRVLGRSLSGVPSSGSGLGQFNAPFGVAVSSTVLVVADTNNARLQIFDLAGNALRQIALPKNKGDATPAPYAVAIDAKGNFYVTDRNNEQVDAFTAGGTQIYGFANTSEFKQLNGIAVSPSGYAYVSDEKRSLIQKLDSFPEVASAFGADFDFKTPEGTALDHAVNLYVTDSANNQILKFALNGPPTHRVLVPLVDDLSGVLGGTLGTGGSAQAPGGADATFGLRDVFVFPNPAKGGAKPTIHVEAGVADQVTIKIFNLAGQQMAATTLSGVPTVIDSGSGPRYAYEFTWNDRIASGIYFYLIDAEKAGQHLTKHGKFAVVR